MEVVKDNKLLNMFFQVAITVCLVGVAMYFLQEITTLMEYYTHAYVIFLGIADFIGIFAIIGFIVWMYLPKQKELVLNITIILAFAYVLLYLFGHFFAPMFVNNNLFALPSTNFLDQFMDVGLSFTGLLVLVVLTIGAIVFFAMQFGKKEELSIFEKFVILLWVLVIAIFDFTSYYYIRQFVGLGNLGFTPFVGLSFLPTNIEFIFLIVFAIIIAFKFFMNINEETNTILNLLLMNMVFITYAISTVNLVGFNFNNAKMTPSIIGHLLFLIGAFMVVITSFFVLREKYAKKTTSSS
ncbi:MAG: hypothetical protein U9O98_07865 [Asgard group archaeon]|nr:hypothetical protein [Asgard group archaeon]